MKKIYSLFIFTLIALFAISTFAQDKTNKKNAKENPTSNQHQKTTEDKKQAEEKAWIEINKLLTKQRFQKGEELEKTLAALLEKCKTYLDNYFNLEKKHTELAVNFAAQLLVYFSKTEEALAFSKKYLAVKELAPALRQNLQAIRYKLLFQKGKYDQLVKELDEVIKTFEDKKLTDAQKLILARLLYHKICAFVMLKKSEEKLKKLQEKLAALKNKTTNKQIVNYIANISKRANQFVKIHAGVKAPNFKLKTLKGKEISLADYKGKYVLLNFFATWDQLCRKLMKEHLAALYKKYQSADFVLIAIGSRSEMPTKQQKFMSDNKYNWLLVHDINNEAARNYLISVIPFSVLIDKQGKVVETAVGLENFEKIEQYLDKVLAKKQNDKPK